jgi:hypothetical protein
MNYLAHSLPFVFDDDDLACWRVAGTALPDWLRVVDRRARLRPDVLSRAPVDDPRFEALVTGARRHHDDDERFHTHDAFEAATTELTLAIRARAPGLRASALAHVLVEMLVDAALIERHPRLLDRFYAAVDALDDDVVTTFVRATTERPLPHVGVFLDRFRAARFLAEYTTDAGVLGCLRGVWLRAGLGPVDDAVHHAIVDARPRVASLLDELRW